MFSRSQFIQNAVRLLLGAAVALSLAGISITPARALTYTVTNLNNSGAGSLRQAILNANAHAGSDLITFNLSGTITLASSLPNIIDHLKIDGGGKNIIISGNDLHAVMYIASGITLTLNRLTIVHGNADTSGGAIFNYMGTLIVTNSIFNNNHATNYGGAIYVTGGSLNVTNTKFGSNSANAGGAIKTYDSTAAISNSTFSNNSADNGGAGIFNDVNSTLTVSNSTFSGNDAYWGGGIASSASTLIVLSSTFSGNIIITEGGGINVASGSFILKNSILANSTGGADCRMDVPMGTNTHNLIENNSGCGTPVSTSDPLLGPLASNGGITRTFALLPGSPAIDAGDDANCSAAPVNGFDQRGELRPYGAHCDIGSYELKTGKLTVRSNGPEDGWVLESSEDSTSGGSHNTAGTTLRLGDDALDRQYRVILSFVTMSLPDNAVITRAVLKLRYQGLTGSDPFSVLGGLKVDIRKPYFGPIVDLENGDFSAAAGKAGVATFNDTPVSGWYSAILAAGGYPYISLVNVTQFRLRFFTDDNNNNIADYVRFYSGDYGTSTARPKLVIDYYVP